MASVEAVTMTESALAEQVKVFITRFRKNGQYTYVDKIDAMMPKRIKAAVIDYNDLVAYPMLDSMFNENPDRILRAFSAAIGEIFYERFPDYAIKIRDDIRARIVNYPVQRSLREINAEIINKMTCFHQDERRYSALFARITPAICSCSMRTTPVSTMRSPGRALSTRSCFAVTST